MVRGAPIKETKYIIHTGREEGNINSYTEIEGVK